MTTRSPWPRSQSRASSIGMRIALGAVTSGLLFSLTACGGSATDAAPTSTNAASPAVPSRMASAEELASASPAASDPAAQPTGTASTGEGTTVASAPVQIDQGAYVTYTNSSSRPMQFWGAVGRFGEDRVFESLEPSESTTFWGWHVNPIKAAVAIKGLVCLDEECTEGGRIVTMEFSTRTVQAADRKGTRQSATVSVGQSHEFTIGDQDIVVVRKPNTENKSSQWQVTFQDLG